MIRQRSATRPVRCTCHAGRLLVGIVALIAATAAGAQQTQTVEIRPSCSMDTKVYSPDPLTECAAMALDSWLRERYERYELVAASNSHTYPIRENAVRISASDIPATEVVAPRMTVWIDMWAGDRHIRKVPVIFSVRAFREVWVAVRDLSPSRGGITEGALVRHVVDLAAAHVRRPASQIDGKRLRLPILAGQVLTELQLEELPTVFQGNRVTLRTQVGTLAVDTQVEVLRSGWHGEIVLVKAPKATGPVTARVLGPDLVELLP